MDHERNLPLFDWRPCCQMIPFPMVHRVGKIRDVANKMLDKASDRHADYYRDQVSSALVKQFTSIGLSTDEQAQQLAAFWEKVRDEMTRQTYQGSTGSNPRGAA